MKPKCDIAQATGPNDENLDEPKLGGWKIEPDCLQSYSAFSGQHLRRMKAWL
jgi:hypothetical protein